jgi:hypothetical protein
MMNMICPLCNGLQDVTIECPLCGRIMSDGGTIESFWGPYSPYMDTFNDENYCVHLLFCPYCHYDSRKAWEMVIV